MKFILVTVLWLTIYIYFSDAKWCIQETTRNTQVTKKYTKTVTRSKTFWRVERKTVWYTVTELVPKVIQRRVCCKGYIPSDIKNSTCKPICPGGCSEFSKCVLPNMCACNYGYQRKGGERCEPICEPFCKANAFCASPNVCQCNSGFEYNFSTKSCGPSETETTSTTLTSSTATSTRSHVPSLDKHSTNLVVMSMSTTISFSTTSEPLTTSERTSEGLHDENSNKSSFKSDDCKEDKLCAELSTEKYYISTERTSSSKSHETSYNASKERLSTNCEYECLGGFCINSVCQCPKGKVLLEESNTCVNISCDSICRNGICTENGICEWKLSEKIKRYESVFPWMLALLTVVSVAIFGLLIMKKLRKHGYNVNKIEKERHRIQFVCEENSN